ITLHVPVGATPAHLSAAAVLTIPVFHYGRDVSGDADDFPSGRQESFRRCQSDTIRVANQKGCSLHEWFVDETSRKIIAIRHQLSQPVTQGLHREYRSR